MDHAQDVAWDSMLTQEFVTPQCLGVGGLASLCKAMAVMHFLWSVQADPRAKSLSSQKAAPLFIEKSAVGLNPVDDSMVNGLMLALQFNDFVKVLQSEQGRLPAVPGKGITASGQASMCRRMYSSRISSGIRNDWSSG